MHSFAATKIVILQAKIERKKIFWSKFWSLNLTSGIPKKSENPSVSQLIFFLICYVHKTLYYNLNKSCMLCLLSPWISAFF